MSLVSKEYQALFYKGASLDSMKYYEQVIEMYDKAILLNPKYHKAYINQGLSLKRFDESIQVFRFQNDIFQDQIYYSFNKTKNNQQVRIDLQITIKHLKNYQSSQDN